MSYYLRLWYLGNHTKILDVRAKRAAMVRLVPSWEKDSYAVFIMIFILWIKNQSQIKITYCYTYCIFLKSRSFQNEERYHGGRAKRSNHDIYPSYEMNFSNEWLQSFSMNAFNISICDVQQNLFNLNIKASFDSVIT